MQIRDKKLKALHKPNIRVIFSDLDGTLLSPSKFTVGKVRTFTLATLNRFLEDGERHLIIATGRNVHRAKAISKWLEMRLGGYKIPYLICLNGGVLYNNRAEETIYSKCFKTTQLPKLLKYLRRHFLVVYLVATEDGKIFTENHWFSRIVGRKFARKYNAKLHFSTVENYKKGWQKVQKVVLVIFRENIDRIRVLIESKFSEFYVAAHGKHILELIDRKVNKFDGIERILELEGWALSECCAIGNEQNDLKMIEKCGFGVAVNFDSGKSFKYRHNFIDFYTSNSEGKAVARAISSFS